MNKKERWFTALAFVSSAFPIIIMAFILKVLPNHIPIIDFDTPIDENIYTSKYNNLITAVFYLIPLAVVLIARYIKRKIKDFGNYIAIQCVSIVLSLSFTTIALMGFLEQVEAAPELKSLDLIGLLAVILSVLTALLGMVTRYRKYNSLVAINNRYTRSSPSVWRTVHRTASSVQIAGFVILSIVLAFLKAWIAIVVLLVSIAVFIVWLYCYSYAVKVMLDTRRASGGEEAV